MLASVSFLIILFNKRRPRDNITSLVIFRLNLGFLKLHRQKFLFLYGNHAK